jgi:hypothetical protein
VRRVSQHILRRHSRQTRDRYFQGRHTAAKTCGPAPGDWLNHPKLFYPTSSYQCRVCPKRARTVPLPSSPVRTCGSNAVGCPDQRGDWSCQGIAGSPPRTVRDGRWVKRPRHFAAPLHAALPEVRETASQVNSPAERIGSERSVACCSFFPPSVRPSVSRTPTRFYGVD